MLSFATLTAIAAFVLILSISDIHSSFGQSSAWTRYNDPTYGVQITYPRSWQLDIGQVVDVPGDYLTSIAVMYPIIESKDEDTAAVYVAVGIDSSVQPINIEQYLDDVINSYMSEDSGLEDLKIIERDTTKSTISGERAYRLVFTYQDGGQERKVLETGSIHKDQPHYLSYDAEEDLFSKYLSTVEYMAKTLRITK
jgi:hypothetical protein